MIRRVPSKLPPKRQHPRSGIERVPKRIWLRHRKFVRSHCCCVPGCMAQLVDVAHLRGVNNAGTSLKPHDWFTVPLCRNHHEQQEPAGPDAFGDRWGIDLWAIAAELARKSPDAKMRVAMLEQQLDEPAPALTQPIDLIPIVTAPPRTGPANDDVAPTLGFTWFELIPGEPAMIPILGVAS